MDGLMDYWMDGWINRWQIDGWMNKQAVKLVDRIVVND